MSPAKLLVISKSLVQLLATAKITSSHTDYDEGVETLDRIVGAEQCPAKTRLGRQSKVGIFNGETR